MKLTQINGLNELAAAIHANAKAHGWYEPAPSFPEVIATMHSELSEALEQYRAGKDTLYFGCKLGGVNPDDECADADGTCHFRTGDGDICEKAKPQGIAAELADAVMRILDTCAYMGIDIERVIALKHPYNTGREYRHGGKKIQEGLTMAEKELARKQCEVCAGVFELDKGQIYEAKKHNGIADVFAGVEVYDVIDCPYCGCQNRLAERLTRIEEPGEADGKDPGADMAERGEGEADEKNEGATLAPVKPGDTFNYGGMEWIALDHKGGATLALAAELIGNQPFDVNDCNDWRKSSLREYLNGEFLEGLLANGAARDDIFDRAIDLIADDGSTEYETDACAVGLITCDEYRKHRQFITRMSIAWWTATPWSTPGADASNSCNARFVHSSGALYNSHAFISNCGVRPLLALKSSILVSTAPEAGE